VSSEQTFNNQNLNVSLTRSPGSVVVLDIHVQPQATAAAHSKAIRNINKEVSLPGFRKGHAPETMVLKNFARYVEKEWRDIVIQTAFSEALDLTKVFPYRKEGIRQPKLKSISLDEGASIIVEYEAIPEVPTVDFSTITLTPIEKKAVTEEQTQHAVDDIRFQHAEWTSITDRPAQTGDYVTIDIHSLEGEKPDLLFEDTRFKIEEDHMGKWMRDLVIGLNIGDTAEGTTEQDKKKTDVTYDKDFKPTKCRITVKAIETAVLPELDEAFAEKLKVKDVADLKHKVSEQLDKMAAEEQESAMREQLSTQLINTYHFELPKSLVEPDMKRSSQLAVKRIRSKQKEGEDLSKEAQEAAEKAAKSVEESYRLFFLLRKIASDQNIDVGQDEIMYELIRQMYAAPHHERIISPKDDPQESRARIYAYLLERKAKDWLIQQIMGVKEKA
jgi:trigger factor